MSLMSMQYINLMCVTLALNMSFERYFQYLWNKIWKFSEHTLCFYKYIFHIILIDFHRVKFQKQSFILFYHRSVYAQYKSAKHNFLKMLHCLVWEYGLNDILSEDQKYIKLCRDCRHSRQSQWPFWVPIVSELLGSKY